VDDPTREVWWRWGPHAEWQWGQQPSSGTFVTFEGEGYPPGYSPRVEQTTQLYLSFVESVLARLTDEEWEGVKRRRDERQRDSAH
jgi:hypothetical protein